MEKVGASYSDDDQGCPICKGEVKGRCSFCINHWFCVHGHEWYIRGDELVIGSKPENCKPGKSDDLDVRVVSDDELGIIQMQFGTSITHFEMNPMTAQQVAFHILNHAFKVLHNKANAHEKTKGKGGGV